MTAAPPARPIEAAAQRLRDVRTEIGKRIVGLRGVVEELLVALLAEGNVLLVGVPGLAKTLLVQSIAEVLALRFSRIQFTPDLMPSDITGTGLIDVDPETGMRAFRFREGPIFANVILADEINRTPPKTQAALIEAMEERQVTAGGRKRPLPRPFFVLATQNPIEQMGTYPLPISQLDRFIFHTVLDYPAPDEEERIVILTTSAYAAPLAPIVSNEEIGAWIDLARAVRVPPPVLAFAAAVVRRTRPLDPEAPPAVREFLSCGAGPRAAQALLAAARSHALLAGEAEARIEDARRIVLPILRHRLIRNYHAEAEGVSPDAIVGAVLATLPPEAPARSAGTKRGGTPPRPAPDSSDPKGI
ncbi:MAG: AAA family ATPase [Planctomycetes bacterium]|nr:AAA family ATPase [Planctomycetota bacterium]